MQRRGASNEEELGSFFLTDYLVRHFDTLIFKGLLALDRFPHLRDEYFKHYTRLVYISQSPSAQLIADAEQAAKRLQLKFEHRPVGYGLMTDFLKTPSTEPAHV